MRIYTKLITVAIALCAFAHASLKLELTQGLESKITVALVGFELPGGDIMQVKNQLMADLSLSGEVRVIDLGKIVPRKEAIAKAKKKGANYLVRGEVSSSIIAKYYNLESEFYSLGNKTSTLIDTSTYNFKNNDLITFVHVLDDDIYNKATGVKGLFSTKIAYILTESKAGMKDIYNLEVADFDGSRSQTIVSSNMPLASPAWSHNGKKIAYVSFEGGMPNVYVQELLTGKREKVTDEAGINSSPSFAPDDKSLVLELSTDGVPKVYTLDLATHIVNPIKSTAYDIDAEPIFSPDGHFIYFTSNRAGYPNIYKYDIELEVADRLSFTGDYNASSAASPDSGHLVYLHREGGLFSLNDLDLISGAVRVLVSDGFERTPVISPNSNVVAYASRYASRSILGFISLDKKIKWRLPAVYGNISDPAWSPFMAKQKNFLVNYSLNEA